MKEATSRATLAVVDAHGASIRGGRKTNEDAFLVLDASHEVVRDRGIGHLIAVADGMGGHLGGSVASKAAIDTLVELFDRGCDTDGRTPDTVLEGLFLCASERILERAAADPSCEGMGTTLTAALVASDRLGFAHVGDSRLYRMRDGRLEQLTTDQNLGARMKAEGAYRPEEYERGPLSNALYGYLGKTPVSVQRGSLSIRSGDILLMATDGFYGLIGEAELARLGASWRGARAFVEDALDRVDSQNPRDNATLVACAIERVPDEDV